MADPELPDELRDELRAAWHRYVDLVAPLRPALHAVCRRLTGNVFEAEDLVQDTLLRAFATLGSVHHGIQNPRGYLLRTATNLWIDSLRRRGSEAEALAALDGAPDAAEAGSVRDAGTRLLQRLSPQERAAVVLKDVFEMSLEEIAEVLRTSVGAVKAALHRGRGRLEEQEGGAASRRPRPSLALVDRFVGEPLVLGFTTRRGKEALEQVLRIEEVDGKIARLRGYAFCPETMREIGERLGLRVRTGLYRYPTPAPGVTYVEPRTS
jgi:RNA polymerase sigma factor (sigma-70 family)